ncbi:acetolactate synthase AlsS [Carnimonas bestiolae]|uniref:acetolactate synthase AlsS n=1 Tax=Carnimonas bestiolae TaxID=3402172 RepID=UPI003EDC466E
MATNDKLRNSGADLVVRNLEAHGVQWVFGIPGAKVDRVFDALEDSSIQTVVARHEANAAFMAGAVGRLTGKAGVALVTSGPGCTNLTTGLLTANTEADPMLALGGVVPLQDRLKQVHQTLDTVSLFTPVTKFSAEITSPNAISEGVTNALRAAVSDRPGASFLALPQDIMNSEGVSEEVLVSGKIPRMGAASRNGIEQAAELINNAKQPAILLGMQSSEPRNVEALHQLLNKTTLPVAGTFQAAGAIDMPRLELFAGRVGLWPNQPGDELLKNADVVLTIGYNPAEHEPFKWNAADHKVIHLDSIQAEIDNYYNPDVELRGDIAETLTTLSEQLTPRSIDGAAADLLKRVAEERANIAKIAPTLDNGHSVHPLRIVHELQHLVDDNVTMCVDMGSFHIWIARYLTSFRARQLLISNGQQTMGVALPWAIASALVRPNEKIISVSGDGSFMQSSMELETAVRLNCNIMHVIWIDNHYNMVQIQEDDKYGRSSGVEFGAIDFAAYAESMGAKGFSVNRPDQLHDTLAAAMATQGPSVVAIPVDYSDNGKLMAQQGLMSELIEQ